MSSIVLHCGDCLDPVTGLASLGDGAVAHVVTDPPYSERVHLGKGKERRDDGGLVEALDFAHMTTPLRSALSTEWARVAQRWVLVFCDDASVFLWKRALERRGCEWACKGVWIKEGAAPRMDGTRPGYGTEEICIAHAPKTHGRTRWNGGGKVATYYAAVRDPDRFHPTQKPLALMEALISDFTDPGELVCDPFAGSGTTAVACKRLGRNFVGWERDPKFHAAAIKRIENTKQQYELIPRGPRPKQTKLVLP